MNSDSRPFLAMIWMLGAIASFSAMAVAGREISAELNTFELMLYRSIIGFVIVIMFLALSQRGFPQIRTKRFSDHIKRNVVHFAGQNLWFYAVAVIPLSQLVALEFTNPIWVALLAPLLLGERFTMLKIAVALIGFAGVLVVAQPGVQPIVWGHAAGLGAALGFAVNTILTRKIMRHDTVLCVLFWMTAMQAVFALALSLPGGIPWPSTTVWPWLAVVGVGGLSAHYCLTSALGLAPASIVAPMDFVRLPVITMVGVMVYNEPLMISVFVGGGLIMGANLLNLRLKS